MVVTNELEFICPAVAGEYRAVVPCGLAVDLHFSGPPFSKPIFNFDLRSQILIALLRCAQNGVIGNTKISSLVQMMAVCNKIRLFLCIGPLPCQCQHSDR